MAAKALDVEGPNATTALFLGLDANIPEIVA